MRFNLLVLGGDIFDFRWSRHEELSQSLSEVFNWLEALLEHYPHLRIAYVLGNHDCLLASQPEFHRFPNTFVQFTWEEHQFGIGDQLFLHSDILDAGENLTQLGLYRQRFARRRCRPWLGHAQVPRQSRPVSTKKVSRQSKKG